MLHKNGYYQGFDLSAFLRFKSGSAQLELGVFGGDKYPVVDNLNYYFGGCYLFRNLSGKWYLEINPRLLFSYSLKEYMNSESIARREFGAQIGAGVYRSFRPIELGLSCYAWASDYKVVLTPSDMFIKPDSRVLYHKRGFLPTGVIKLSVRFLLKR